MAETEWYKQWFNSPYYYKLYQHHNEEEAAQFIQVLLNYLNPPLSSKMLDVGCGTGRFSKILAAKGFDVVGIDISEAAINQARSSEQEHLHFYIHDMRLPFWMLYFHYAFSFFTSFGYFNTKRENENALRSVAQSLFHKGIFVIDYLNSYFAAQHLVPYEIKEESSLRFHIKRWVDEYFFYKEISVETNNGALQYLTTEKVARFTLNNFTQMLQRQNMQVQDVFGNYQLKEYNLQQSERMIIVAKKQL